MMHNNTNDDGIDGNGKDQHVSTVEYTNVKAENKSMNFNSI